MQHNSNRVFRESFVETAARGATLLQMLGCDMNKEKNFPNLFPFLFLAENKWSPESSYHDDIGIRQKIVTFYMSYKSQYQLL